MTAARTPPPARPRTRRVIDVDGTAHQRVRQRTRPQSAEGNFEYGEAFSQQPAIRYRQIKNVEGVEAARGYAKAQVVRLLMSGITKQEIAHTFGFSVRWAEHIIAECRSEVRERASSGFDAMNVIAEHLLLYRQLREGAFFAMNRSNATEVDKDRARSSLMSVMRNEFDMIEKIGGFRGVALQGATEDESVVAARSMANRIASLTDAIEDCMEGDLDDSEDRLGDPPPGGWGEPGDPDPRDPAEMFGDDPSTDDQAVDDDEEEEAAGDEIDTGEGWDRE